MNNKETLQSYNTELGENNSNLETILTIINDLPETGSGEDLSDELATYDTELTRQETSIADIVDLLATKGTGTGDTVVINPDNFNIHSEEETAIGTWINGKPIYRRSFAMTSNGTTGATKTFDNFDDIEEIIRCNGTESWTSGTWQFVPYYVGSNDYTKLNVTTNGITLVSAFSNRPTTVIIEYTKISDAVVS